MEKIITLCLCASVLNLSAAVPLRWTVETSRATPAQFEAYQGETLALEAALTSYGKPLEAPSEYSLYWQTNGMGNAWWEQPCNPPSTSTSNLNLMFATWSPTNDVGAKVYTCFIGKPGTIYHAAFQLRLRPSPGAIPNELPLPQKVIDFAQVTVLNPPWSGGGGGGVDTNAVIDIVHKTVDGSAKTLPKYLWLYEADDSYPDAAAEYYRSRGNGKTDGGCSSVRDGGFLYRNFDYPFDDRAEFVVKMSAGPNRFASVGVAQVGTNLTEQMVTSGKPEYSRLYKWLPGATVDGINENGVACNINVVDGDPQVSGWHTNATSEAIHPLAAIRWILDHATNAQSAAEYIALHIAFPPGWTQNFHYLVADGAETYVVEDGVASRAYEPEAVLTNYPLFTPPYEGPGQERYNLLIGHGGASITNVWYSNAYSRETTPPWVSDLADVLAYTNDIFNAWAMHPKEYFRGKTTNGQPWWQTVHTSVYDITNRTLRVAVQEVDDWYVFQVPSSGEKVDAYTKAEADAKLAGKANKNGDASEDFTASTLYAVDFDPTYGETFLQVRDRVSELETDKANMPMGPVPNNIAVFDGVGGLSDSGKSPSDFLGTTNGNEYPSKIYWENDVLVFETQNGNRAFSIDMSDTTNPKIRFEYSEGFGWLEDVMGNTVQDALDAKADRSMLHHTNETFSNEVAAVARTVQPAPSPTLRLFDPVLNRWVILKSVNMNITLEVE